MNQNELTEGYHYYFNTDGNMVFTKQYHIEKGYCCGLGCMHCPYEFKNVPEPKRALLLSTEMKKENS